MSNAQPAAAIAGALAGGPAGCHLYLPPRRPERMKLLVSVHGISRNAGEHLQRFAPLAEAHGVAVLAPVFSREAFPDYQRLGRTGHGLRADLALREMLDGLARRIGLAPPRIHLFGHSGGAQFVHRYVMAYPEHVARYVASAAGWYTLPDPTLPFPLGIRAGTALPGLHLDAEAFLRVPGAVLVGAGDRKRDRALRTSPLVDALQGTTRIERAGAWVQAMNQAAGARRLPPPLTLTVLPEARHRFADMATRGGAVAQAFAFLFGTGAGT